MTSTTWVVWTLKGSQCPSNSRFVRFASHIQNEDACLAALEPLYRERLLDHPDLPHLREVAQAIERQHGSWTLDKLGKLYTEVGVAAERRSWGYQTKFVVYLATSSMLIVEMRPNEALCLNQRSFQAPAFTIFRSDFLGESPQNW